jgi:septal ring factor EnvC (AmiA/AmiB activator)
MPAIERKRTKINIAVIGLSLLVVLLFLAFGWVGYWAYTLNTELTTTQGQLAALQAEHAKLQTNYAALTSDNEKLNAELTQSKADLEQANTDLTTAQADLSKSKDQGKKLDTQIEAAGGLAEILYVMAISDNESDILKIDRLINETNDTQLIKEWDTFTRSPSEDAFNTFFNYLLMATRNSLR